MRCKAIGNGLGNDLGVRLHDMCCKAAATYEAGKRIWSSLYCLVFRHFFCLVLLIVIATDFFVYFINFWCSNHTATKFSQSDVLFRYSHVYYSLDFFSCSFEVYF
jgi:hypothetical protein